MRIRIVPLALATLVAANGAANATDPPQLMLPSPTVVHLPPMPHPPISAHNSPESGEGHFVPHLQEAHSLAPSHAHIEGLEDCHCMPGVYKSEVTKFRGNGFVARKNPFTPDRFTMERAGYPQEISPLAEPTSSPHYTGYYVGGGASLFKGPGYPHRAKEGTWGWDYEHLGLKRRVNLLFSRGCSIKTVRASMSLTRRLRSQISSPFATVTGFIGSSGMAANKSVWLHCVEELSVYWDELAGCGTSPHLQTERADCRLGRDSFADES